jgi:quinol monooxygenase YgiN
MATHMKTTALLKARPGKEGELIALLRSLASNSRSEPGNLRWDLWQDQHDETTFIIDELYRDIDSVQAHRQRRTSGTMHLGSTSSLPGRPSRRALWMWSHRAGPTAAFASIRNDPSM